VIALIAAAVLSQAAPADAPVAFPVPPGSVLLVGEGGEPGEAVRLPPGYFLPVESAMALERRMMNLRAANALLRAEENETRGRVIIAAAIAAAVGLVAGGGAVCLMAGPRCPLIPAK
jgi:hypothetical protein